MKEICFKIYFLDTLDHEETVFFQVKVRGQQSPSAESGPTLADLCRCH